MTVESGVGGGPGEVKTNAEIGGVDTVDRPAGAPEYRDPTPEEIDAHRARAQAARGDQETAVGDARAAVTAATGNYPPARDSEGYRIDQYTSGRGPEHSASMRAMEDRVRAVNGLPPLGERAAVPAPKRHGLWGLID